jgi:hypothetical protein
LKKLGAYDYENPSQFSSDLSTSLNNTKIRRELRPIVILENGAKYEGQWNVEANQRDGKGI